MPMPVDVEISFADGTKEMHTIPLDIMYGAKKSETNTVPLMVEKEWQWTHPTYSLKLSSTKMIKKIAIDPSKRMADIDMSNNTWEK